MTYPHFKTAREPSTFKWLIFSFYSFSTFFLCSIDYNNIIAPIKICLNIIKKRAFLHRKEKFNATHCWSSWASSSSVCQTLSMMSQGLPRLAKREDGTWRKTGNIIFPSGLEIFSPKMEMLEKKNRKYCFSSDLKIFPANIPLSPS